MVIKSKNIRKLALASVFTALGVIISPLFWFPFLTTKAFPGQHMINAITGVLLGPFWAATIAFFIGTIRNLFGIGTVYAFPGGIPGGMVVGIFYWLFKKIFKSEKKASIAALFEPIGTIFIGATLSLFIVAPFIGDVGLLSQLQKGHLIAIFMLGGGWALSSISGSIFGFFTLLILDRMKMNRERLFGKR